MTIIKVFIIFLVVNVAESNRKSFLQGILKPKDNIYTTINTDIQNFINTIFSTLKLSDDFANRTRVNSLLKMHYNLNKIAENNYDVSVKMKSKAEAEANPAADIINLNEIITNIVNENINKTEAITTKFRRDFVHTTEETLTSTISTETLFNDSTEFNNFVGDFVAKLNTLSDTHLYKNKEIVKEDLISFEELKLLESDGDFKDAGGNISVWEPSKSMEWDHNNMDNGTRRIFGGSRAKIQRYPFVVSVWVMQQFMCGGSIIATDMVITAASCLQLLYNNRFYRENPKVVMIRAGTNFIVKRGELIEVLEVFFHPMYNPKTLANNLALLRLLRHLRFKESSRRIKRIEMDDVPATLSSNINGVIILGWGAKRRDQKIGMFPQLMVQKLHVYQLQDCMDVYSSKFVTQKHFCAGFQSTGDGACSRDVGGPGIVGKILVGVISFGSVSCGTPDSPTVFTKVGYYVKWIRMVMRMRVPFGGQLTTMRQSETRPIYWATTRYKPKMVPIKEKENTFITTAITNADFMPTVIESTTVKKNSSLERLRSLVKSPAPRNKPALREKEKGDWRMLCCEEKKALYRASFCQTFAEFQHPTGTWKFIIGVGLGMMSFTFWCMMFLHHYVFEPLPASLSKASQMAQLRRMLELRVNPVDGLSSHWDYDNDRWK